VSAPRGPADAGATGDLARAVADLYQLEPAGFTGARSALAAEARRAGDRDLAQHIAKLARPSRAAFALNLLVHRRPGDVQRLVQLAEALRDASRRLAGAELRELGATRQQLIAELTSAACDLASENGTPPSGASTEEIEESLQAALLDEEAARAVTSGHLARALRMAGVGTPDLSDALPSLPIARHSPAGERPVEKGPPRGQSAGRRPAGAQSVTKRPPGRPSVKAAEDSARRAATAAGAARKEVEKARRDHDRALSRRESAETALVSARRDELASSRALTAAEAAARQAEAALQTAERTTRDARRDAGGAGSGDGGTR